MVSTTLSSAFVKSFALEVLFFCSLHLLPAMLFMIVYLLLSFWFYWFDVECIQVVLFVMCSLWTFLSFWALAFVGFLFLSRDAIFMLSCFFLTAIDSHWTLHSVLCLGCTFLLLTYGQWWSFLICHLEYVFQRSPGVYWIFFHIFIPNISIEKWGPVVVCGLDYAFLIPV